jgi:hypothetical protein
VSPRPRGRTQPCGKAEARTRLAHARAFVDTAELGMNVDDEGSENVAASLAVLAGIAASDASCCAALGGVHVDRTTGGGHALAGVAGVGAEMGKDLARLLDIKDNAQLGVFSCPPRVPPSQSSRDSA